MSYSTREEFMVPHPPRPESARRYDDFQLRLDRLRALAVDSHTRLDTLQSKRDADITAWLPQVKAAVNKLSVEAKMSPRVEQLAAAQQELVQRVQGAEQRQSVLDRLAESGPRGRVRLLHLEAALVRWCTVGRERRRMLRATERLWPVPRAFRLWRDSYRLQCRLAHSIEAKVARAREASAREIALVAEELRLTKEEAAAQRQQQALRRMLHLQLSKGWRTWSASWEQLCRVRGAAMALRNPGLVHSLRRWRDAAAEWRALRQAAGRLRVPALCAAWRCWRAEAAEYRRMRVFEERRVASEEREALRRGLGEQQSSLAAREAAHAREVKRLEQQLQAKDAMLSELNVANDVAVRMRQERVMKRLLHLEIARGFGTWVELADECRRLLHATRRLRSPGLVRAWHGWAEMMEDVRRLRNAASRLRSPALSACWRAWRTWAAEEARRLRDKASASYAGLRERCEALEASLMSEVERSAELEEALAARDAELAAMRNGHVAEMAAWEAAEKRRRQEQAARRMLQLELARGFGAWAELADERRRLLHATRRLRSPGLVRAWHGWAEMMEDVRRLRNAVSRLRSPALSAAWRAWKAFAAEEAERSRLSHFAGIEGSLHQATEAAKRAEEELAARESAHRKEVQSLRKQLAARDAELLEASDATAEAVKQREQAIRQRQDQAMRRMRQIEVARAFSAWEEMANERGRLERAARSLRSPQMARCWREWCQVAEDGRRFTKAVASWRSLGFSMSLREGRKGALDEFSSAAEAKRTEAEEALSALKRQAEDAQRSLTDTDERNADVRRKLEGSFAPGEAASSQPDTPRTPRAATHGRTSA